MSNHPDPPEPSEPPREQQGNETGHVVDQPETLPPQWPTEPERAAEDAPPAVIEAAVIERTFRRSGALWRNRRALAVWLRAAAVLAITGFSLAAFVVEVVGRFSLPDFINDNRVHKVIRLQMLAALGAGALVGLLTALALVRGRGAAAGRVGRVMRTARLLSPLLLLGLGVPLIAAKNWDPLSRVTGIAFLAFLAEHCFRAAAGELIAQRLRLARRIAKAYSGLARFAARLRPSPELLVVLLSMGFYAVWMSYQSILQHHQFGTMAFDLGSYDTTFFNALAGHPFRSTAVLREGKDWSMLSNHAEFTMYALLPFYALRPGPETLLILQAVALASGVIPLFRFASRRLPRMAAMVLALAYLLYAPMHQANFYDVHFQPFAVAFTLWALDMLDARRRVLFAVFFLLAMGCREDVPIGFAVVGIYLLLVGRHVRAAVAMVGVAVGYFVIVKFAVMPRFGQWWFSDIYKELYPPGENSYGGVVKTLITNPTFVWKTLITNDKIIYLFLVMTPVAFLPLRRGLLWMSLLPAAMFTLLTTGYSPTVEISFQYVCLFIPFVFLATALALADDHCSRLGRARMWGAVGAIAVATLCITRVWGAMPPGDRFRGGFRGISEFRRVSQEDKQKRWDLRELISLIPADAKVAISELEHPHVSTRLNCFALRLGYEGADYLLYAEHSGGYGSDNAGKALQSGEYEVMERRKRSGLILLRKKGLTTTTQSKSGARGGAKQR